ncbi:LysR family transcriptional regulator [Marivibrio halodurans]|uniref:LysR family transcriptional regulator n=1 Tax=Marivibrio halodurans TaxID=2039722 RepID=A0A8J7S0E8_9PROT|nr:LysR substrate-binding domain-containing protein [Marivibrio halodurans]MBP5856378.1 LysR family transcriptional regulator [Marivibrio halodurans]
MTRRSLPLNALRAFEAVGRHRNISHAADELALTHAAVSRHIRNLEKELGAALFRRTARGVEPLPHARALLEAMTGSLAAIGESYDALAGRKTTRLTVSCGVCLGMRWLLPRLSDFEAEAGFIEVDVDATPDVVDIARHEADFALRFLPEAPGAETDGIVHDRLFGSAMVPVAAPALAATLDGGGPEALLEAKLLQEDDGRLWSYWFEAQGLSFDRPKRRTTKVTGSVLSIEAAMRGLGVALGPAELIGDEFERGTLAVPRGMETIPFGAYYLVHLPETARRKAGAAFRRWVLAQAAAAG